MIEVTDTLNKFRGKPNCDEKILALTSIDKYPNATVKDAKLTIPSQEAPVPSQQWLTPREEWTKDEFSKQVEQVLDQNFGGERQLIRPDKLDFSSVLPSSSEATGLVNAKDNQYFSQVVNKMMDFASSKYALLNSNLRSDAFASLYRVHYEEYETCQREIEDLQSQIKGLLGSKTGQEAELDSLRSQLLALTRQLEDLDRLHGEQLRAGNDRIAAIDAEIAEYRRLQVASDEASRSR